MDTEQGIRTNTTILLGNVAQYLTQDTREKVLSAAFTRALRDPFAPARAAAIAAYVHTEQYYSVRECATKVVPALSWMTVDADADVRVAAIDALRTFVKKLEDGQGLLVRQQQQQQQKGLPHFFSTH